ncbi:FAD-dependent oxidoreductase [Paenibacillus soyae]|uniref:FAD-dependent oxidoreductase n=1 Tax=Paenibacillus soyae TaxID=2969249 RepID=A0A9X2MW53_9BACL|nr:FAD-dependent oxidoreductase [Paenibacillus soyae]MCR2807422.1 FAD-dependent oxidoreductase [Paenibacillus soyae]
MNTLPSIVKKERIPELQLVRAIAIIGVLSVHASASATIYMQESAYYFFYNLVNIFMRFGTPTFILLSSFVLFYSYYNRPLDRKLITGFYKKRLLYILIPYIVFSAIYFVYIKLVNNQPLLSPDSLQEFWTKLRKGDVYSHLYFVYISIQFYLLFPIVLWVAKRWPRIAYGFIPFGFAAQWIFVVYNYYVEPVPDKGSWSLSYFSFFFTGAFLGIYYPKVKKWIAMTREHATAGRVAFWLLLLGAWLTVALSHVYMYHNARANGVIYHGLWYEYLWNFHTLFSAFTALGLSFFIYRHLPKWISGTLHGIGQLSFGIYLIHLLFLFLYDRFIPHFGSALLEHLRYFGSWAVMLAGSWITVALVSRFVPFGWILFGQVPAREVTERPSGTAVKKKVVIASVSLLLIAIVTTAAGYAWLRTNSTENGHPRQELETIASASEIRSGYDVIVAGTDAEGIAAAISAARNGLSVLLVDGRERDILGGLLTEGGLNSLDLNYSPKKSAIPGQLIFLNKGIFQEWYDQLEGTSFDVHSAANAFNRMVKEEENIDLLLKAQSMEPLVEAGPDGTRAVKGLRIVQEDGTALDVTAPSVIDATQDGDIAASAGVPYTLGRADIGEPDAQMAVTLVFALKGVTQEIWDSFDDIPDTSIDSMSAWGFHKAKDYVSSNPERVKLRGLNVGRQNDDTILINAMHIFQVDPLDPDSLRAAMEIGQAEAPRIVEYLKETYEQFESLEFAYTFDELYVRESRHIEGEYRLTMADLLDNRDHWDAIAYGSYDVDIQAASHTDWGYVLYSPAQYGVPFRTLVPLEVDGLLVVGRAASFDSLPHGSARVIPLGMATGQAAGAAAKLAAENGMSFRELSRSKELIAELRQRLTDQGMDLYMNVDAIETPYYKSHKAYRGLVAAVSMLLTSGGENNMDFDLDGKSNPERVVNSMRRVSKQHPDFFLGDPSAALVGVAEPFDEQPLSLEQAVKTIGSAIGGEEAAALTLDEFVARGWLLPETLDAIDDRAAITNGEFFMIVRDVVEFYAGVVYE